MIAVRHFGRGEWGIITDHYSPLLKTVCRQVPGMRFNYPKHAWCGYSDAVTVAVRAARAAGLRVQGDVVVDNESPLTVNVAYGDGTRDYQKIGIDFLVRHAAEGALLADDVGLGKTMQACRAMRALRQKDRVAVVVCPSFVRDVWEQQIPKWWPGARVAFLNGVKPEKRGSIFISGKNNAAEKHDIQTIDFTAVDVVVVHYDIVHAWVEILSNFIGCIVFDEIHYLMSMTSRRSLGCRQLARAAAYRIGLSATPMTSRPRDLWNPIDTLSEGRFGEKPFPFLLRHCDGHKVQVTPEKTVWKFDGASHLEELQERLTSGIMLRRTKSEVAIELPPRTRQVISVEVEKRCLVSPTVAMANEKQLRKALDLAADGKLSDVASLAADYAAAGSKVVVFCHRKAVAETVAMSLSEADVNAVYTHGGHDFDKRRGRIAQKPDVLCVTIDSIAVGVDLSYADVGIFAELTWVPSSLIQAEGRLHRFGAVKPVLFIYVIARGSIDEIIKSTVLAKVDKFDRGVGKTDYEMKETLRKKEEDEMADMFAEMKAAIEKGDDE